MATLNPPTVLIRSCSLSCIVVGLPVRLLASMKQCCPFIITNQSGAPILPSHDTFLVRPPKERTRFFRWSTTFPSGVTS